MFWHAIELMVGTAPLMRSWWLPPLMSLGMLSIELESFGMNYINRRSTSVKCSKAQHFFNCPLLFCEWTWKTMFMTVGTHFLCLRLFISALYHETQKALIDAAAQEGDPFISNFFSGHEFLFISHSFGFFCHISPWSNILMCGGC